MAKSESDICRMTLLVVDYALDADNFLAERLSENYPTQRVLRARDDLSVMKLAVEMQPDIFIIDLSVQGCDGLILSKKLIYENKNRILIHVSDTNDCEIICKCYESGSKYFTCKPINYDNLFFKLDSIMIDLFYRRFNMNKGAVFTARL